MAGLWDTIKAEAPSAPRSIVNDDIQEAIDPVRGAPVKGQRTEGLKFAPVDASAYRELESNNAVDDDEPRPRFTSVSESLAVSLENPNLDLVMEDVPAYTIMIELPAAEEVPKRKPCTDGRGKIARAIAAREKAKNPKGGGRPRVHQTNAERQKAYRDRQKQK